MRAKRAAAETARRVRTISLAETASPDTGPAFAGDAPLVRRLREQLASAAALGCPVLMVGEPGSGRTRAARWLHAQKHSSAPFIALRGLPPRGEGAGSATVYAHQLDEASLAVQAEWRRWLAQAPADVRLIASAASAWPLEQADAELFAELRRFAIAVPPLRERRDDLAALAADMAGECARRLATPLLTLSPGALNALRRAHWLASAADLQRAIERLAAHTRAGETVSAALASAVLEELRPTVAALRLRERERERDALLRALSEAGGNLARAARQLGRSRAAVYRLIAKHGIALGGPR